MDRIETIKNFTPAKAASDENKMTRKLKVNKVKSIRAEYASS
jgi:hypothetical protein